MAIEIKDVDYEKGAIPLSRPQDENFCQLYVLHGNACAAHKEAYPEQAANSHLAAPYIKLKRPKFRNRCFFLQREARELSQLNSNARVNMAERAVNAAFYSALDMKTGEVKDTKAFKSFIDAQQLYARLTGEWDEKLTVTQNVSEVPIKVLTAEELKTIQDKIKQDF